MTSFERIRQVAARAPRDLAQDVFGVSLIFAMLFVSLHLPFGV